MNCTRKLKQEFIVVPLSCIFPENSFVNSIYETSYGYYRYVYLLGYDLKNEVLLSLSVSGGAGIKSLFKDAVINCYSLKGKYCKWFIDRILTCGSIDEISHKMYLYIYKAIMYLIEKRMIYVWFSNTSFFTFVHSLRPTTEHNNVATLQNFNSFIINPYTSRSDVAAFVLGLVEIPRIIRADITVKSVACEIRLNEINCKIFEMPATLPKGISVPSKQPILALLRYNSSTNAIEILGSTELDPYSASYYVFGKTFMISKIMYRFQDVPNVSIKVSQLSHVYSTLANVLNSALFKNTNINLLHFDEALRALKNANIVIQKDDNVALANFDTYLNFFISKLNPKAGSVNIDNIEDHDTRVCIVETFVSKHCNNYTKTRCLNAIIL